MHAITLMARKTGGGVDEGDAVNIVRALPAYVLVADDWHSASVTFLQYS